MEECFIVGPLCIILGVLVGKYSKRVAGIGNIKHKLNQLNEQTVKLAHSKAKYELLYSRLYLASRVALAVLALIACILMYHSQLSLLSQYQMSSVAVLLAVGCLYAATCLVNWLYTQSEKHLSLHEKEKANSKNSLIKELGEDIVEAVKQDEDCSKSCKTKMQTLRDQLKSHSEFINELASFQWCDACFRNGNCAKKCGGEFCAFTKNAMTRYNLARSK